MDRELIIKKAGFWTKLSFIILLLFLVMGGVGLILNIVLQQLNFDTSFVISMINIIIQIIIVTGLAKAMNILKMGNAPEQWSYVLNISFLIYSLILSLINTPTAMEKVPVELRSTMMPWIIIGYILTIFQMFPSLMAWFKVHKLLKIGLENGK